MNGLLNGIAGNWRFAFGHFQTVNLPIARVFSFLDDASGILSPRKVAFLETDDVENDEGNGPQRPRLDTPRLQATSAVPHRVR